MFGWVAELIMPSSSQPEKTALVAPAAESSAVVAAAPSVPIATESREEAQRRLRVEAASEVMLHVADGRLEMAALMLRQAEADLERDQQTDAEWAKHVGPLRESLDAAKKRLILAIRDELKNGTGSGQTGRCCKLLCMVNQGLRIFFLFFFFFFFFFFFL
jgi:hypothetical protein